MTAKRMSTAPCPDCGREWPHSNDLHESPRTPTPLDAAWEALAADIHANGYSVRDAIARHRPPIEAEARAAPDPAPLDVERLARALLAVIDSGWHTDGSVGRLEIEQEWWYTPRELAAVIAREYAKDPQP